MRRNAFGTQVDSFEADLAVPAVSADPVHAVFIRAPAVVRVGEGVEVLAAVPASRAAGADDDGAPAADLPVGESRQVEVDGRVLLLHRQGETEITAYSNVCTHQGCAVEITERDGETTFGCPCHGSHFDPVTGRPYGGPAKKPLTDFEARVEGEQVQVKL